MNDEQIGDLKDCNQALKLYSVKLNSIINYIDCFIDDYHFDTNQLKYFFINLDKEWSEILYDLKLLFEEIETTKKHTNLY